MQTNEISYFGAAVTFANALLNPSSVADAQIVLPSAGVGVQATKLIHRYRAAFKESGVIAATTLTLHVVRGTTAALNFCGVGCIVAPTNPSTVVVNFILNGSAFSPTPLTVTLTSASPTRILVSTSVPISGAPITLATGSWIDMVLTTTGTPSASGLYVEIEVDESPL